MPMTWTPAYAVMPTHPGDDLPEARRQVTTYFQSVVNAGFGQWRINDAGQTELHLKSGEAYLLGETGVTRLA